MIVRPHFSLPFRFTGPQAAVVEQDSVDEITDCCTTVILCPLGFRVELPSFGVSNPVFTPTVDVDSMRTAIGRWEPRAQTLITENIDALDELISRVEVTVQARTEE